METNDTEPAWLVRHPTIRHRYLQADGRWGSFDEAARFRRRREAHVEAHSSNDGIVGEVLVVHDIISEPTDR